MKKTDQRFVFWLLMIFRGLCLIAGAASGFLAFMSGGDSEVWPVYVFFASVCVLCLWFALRGHLAWERVLILVGAASGIVVGLFAFWGGLFWAGYRYPDSNVSGLVAYLYTGPLGFSIGAVLGVFLADLLHRRRDRH